MCWTPSRWFGVSMNPPVPGVDASTKVSGETQSAFPVVSMTCTSETPLLAQASPGRPAPGAAGRGSPRRRRSRRPRRRSAAARSSTAPAPTSRSATASVEDDADHHHPVRRRERLEHLRRLGDVRQRVRLREALRHHLPGSIEVRAGLEDEEDPRQPGSDSERMSSRNATPASRSCSIGTVISCSTSAADSPSASVWTSTVGGTNSGSTSTGMSRSWLMPTTSIATAAATTRSRNFRLDSTIERTAHPRLPRGPQGSSGAQPTRSLSPERRDLQWVPNARVGTPFSGLCQEQLRPTVSRRATKTLPKTQTASVSPRRR